MINITNWWPDAKQYWRADLIAGLTLWALIVPQSIAYAGIAGAPNLAAGLYCVMFVLPVYALFASSRFLVPSPTTAVSATFAGFLAVMVSEPQIAFSSLVIATALAYFLFAILKLGFLTDFISMPVSMGYMSGLSIIVIVGQLPKLFGVEAVDGNVLQALAGLFKNLPQSNITTFIISLIIFAMLLGLPKLSNRLPAGLIALLVSMMLSAIFNLGDAKAVDMVGALPRGLPPISIPIPKWDDVAVIIPASIGLVILASGEASVTAQSLAAKHGQNLDMNRQFFAFGMGNLVGGLFGGMLGTGASSASMVNETSGARTLASTLWAALASLITVLLFTSVFDYLPNAFLAALVITAVWKLLNFKKIWQIRTFSHGEFGIAALALVSVLALGILNGLLISMLINVLYAAYRSSKIHASELGADKDDSRVLLPLNLPNAKKLDDHIVAFGLTQGQLYYASVRQAVAAASQLMDEHKNATKVVVSLSRMDALDYTSSIVLCQFSQAVQDSGRKLYLTGVRSEPLMRQLDALGLGAEVDISSVLDTAKL